jgi:fluoride ion exporter CrcB/FEX
MSEVVTVETKRWFHSKTLWVNVIGTLIAILSLTEFMAVIPKEWTPSILLVIGVLNIILRSITTQPIGLGADMARKVL